MSESTIADNFCQEWMNFLEREGKKSKGKFQWTSINSRVGRGFMDGWKAGYQQGLEDAKTAHELSYKEVKQEMAHEHRERMKAKRIGYL